MMAECEHEKLDVYGCESVACVECDRVWKIEALGAARKEISRMRAVLQQIIERDQVTVHRLVGDAESLGGCTTYFGKTDGPVAKMARSALKTRD
jgi:hypothetical protein